MTATAKFSGFYRGAINLWVEDPLTEQYLRRVWQDDPAVVFYVGGGTDGIGAVLEETRIAEVNNVFAYVDRDFRLSNRNRWKDPRAQVRRFLGAVHEVENHLLDCDALASCSLNTGQRSAADIRSRLLRRATELAWWMACRRLIAETKERTLQDFPTHPKCEDVRDRSSAEAYIVSQAWWTQIQAFVPTLANADLAAALIAHHTEVLDWLKTDQWLIEFSGKELFRHIRGWVSANPGSPASSAELDADLAKDVGEWQANHNHVPPELIELLAALKMRAGVP